MPLAGGKLLTQGGDFKAGGRARTVPGLPDPKLLPGERSYRRVGATGGPSACELRERSDAEAARLSWRDLGRSVIVAVIRSLAFQALFEGVNALAQGMTELGEPSRSEEEDDESQND